jgi:hypothetical protein
MTRLLSAAPCLATPATFRVCAEAGGWGGNERNGAPTAVLTAVASVLPWMAAACQGRTMARSPWLGTCRDVPGAFSAKHQVAGSNPAGRASKQFSGSVEPHLWPAAHR